MRKLFVTAATAAVLSAAAFLSGGANAMTLTAPAGVRSAADGMKAAEQVRYVCRNVRRHGVWRRVCEWRPNYGYYGYGSGYGYRPYYAQPYPYYGYYGYGYRRPGVYLRF